MRIHHVEMTGFGPFRETQRVDLDAFAGGLFLISGPTGAGKSTILDAIVYALYNAAPRYGSTTGIGGNVRSDHCGPDEPTRVEVVFSVGDRTYRIVRSPEYERPKARGTGTTTEKATAELSRREDDGWVGVASQLRTVGEALSEVLPLDREQFLQVALLAQGQFQRFLVARSEDRQDVLRSLFRTERFTRYDHELKERAKLLGDRLAQSRAAIDDGVRRLVEHTGAEAPEQVDDGWLGALLDEHETDVALAASAMEQATKEFQEADAALRAAQDLADRQRRLREASETHDRLVSRAETIAADRRRRDRAVAADAVLVSHRAVVDARRDLDRAREAFEAAERDFTEVVGGAPRPDLPAQVRAWDDTLAVLNQLLADERELESRRTALEQEQDALRTVREQVEQTEAAVAQVRARLDEPLAVTVESATALCAELEDELRRSRERASLHAELARAEAAYAETAARRTAASAAVDDLTARRMAEYAGVLAQELQSGSPCAVCGSVEHPRPAVLTDDAVGPEQIEAAEQALAEAMAAADAARIRVVELRARIEAVGQVRAVEVLEPLVADARATVEEAEQAAGRRSADAAEVERLDGRLKELHLERASRRERLAGLTRQIVDLERKIEAAREGSGSIVERIEVVREHSRVGAALVAARGELARAQSSLEDATGTFEAALEHHGFEDEEAFGAALLDAESVRALDRAIAEHDAELARVEAVLADPQLRDLPAEPVDVDEPRRLREVAQTVCHEAVRAHEAAQQAQRTTVRLVEEIRVARSRDAARRAEFETLDRLARTVHGESPNTRRMRLESYVLGVELDEIIEAANERLRVMSSGRYRLHRSDETATRGTNAGLEVRVFDDYTGRSRKPESLSGGKKFLGSLALALGLAEVVTQRAGGVRLDTLFIDEGFGSLDGETLDLAMHTIESLREHGRTIGLISHVESMKERIAAKVIVEKTPAGPSRIVQETSVVG